MKKFLKEFKQFVARGSVIDLAVGIIIGGAFQKIVTSAVNDLILPFMGLLTGDTNFNERFIVLRVPDNVTAEEITSISKAKELGASTFNYGAFISSILDFIIMALVIFLIIKAINKMKNIVSSGDDKSIESKEPETKSCPYCLSEIPYAAVKCAHCTSNVAQDPLED